MNCNICLQEMSEFATFSGREQRYIRCLLEISRGISQLRPFSNTGGEAILRKLG